jgi:hypothetical protein
MKPHDKQLRDILLPDVLEKQRLGEALNAKEFAVVAGVSYSTARGWYRLPGFPVFRGVVFWQDFEQWRKQQNGLSNTAHERPARSPQPAAIVSLSPRAAKILLQG